MDQKYKQTQVWVWARGSWVGESLRAARMSRREFWAWACSTWIAEALRACRKCQHELWAWARSEHAELPHVHQLTESIAALHMSAPDAVSGESDPEAPIFLLSTAMRSGSTLLQRILVT